VHQKWEHAFSLSSIYTCRHSHPCHIDNKNSH
jgi:hypothetical protein